MTGTGSRRGRPLAVKLAGTALAFLTAVGAVTTVEDAADARAVLLERMDALGRALSGSAASCSVEPLLVEDAPVLESHLRYLADRNDDVARVRVERRDGVVVAEARRGAGPDAAAGLRTYEERVPSPVAGEPPLGRVVLELSTAGFETLSARRLKLVVLRAGAGFVLVGAFLAFLIKRSVGDPLRRLDAKAEALGRGDLETRIECASHDELGRLAATLDGMRANLRSSYDELKARNRSLAEALEQATAAARAKTEFLATLSHEVRTPINGIAGTNALLLGGRLDPDQRDLLETQQRAAEDLTALIEDLLDFAKIDARRVSLQDRVFDLAGTIEEAARPFAERAAGKGLAFVTRLPSDLPSALRGDPTRLRQILMNLLGNAVKFTESGRVELAVEPWTLEGGGRGLRFTVVDSGTGVPETAVASLFEPFSQADGSSTRRFGGLGLGLAISARLVALMGGKIGYRAAPGGGSEFWFLVPCEVAVLPSGAPAAEMVRAPSVPSPRAAALLAAPAGTAPPATAAEASQLRILLVEDNEVNRKIAVRLLERWRHRVDVACDGVEAVRRVGEDRFDLVLMDCAMPRMDGYEAARRIRASEAEAARHTPIVALTANVMEGDRERCLAAGMDDYLPKPIVVDALAAALRRWGASRPAPGPAAA